eukprot:GEMP01026019.1.p1 GENE.GEMP01026019.1~~GEMP01026019.1.p1  ORF type:complete len:332 (+),score=53.54 GEMP01026019.1:53-1048(+)
MPPLSIKTSSSWDGQSFCIVDEKENTFLVLPSNPSDSEKHSSLSCSARSSTGLSFALINSPGWVEEFVEQVMGENRDILELLRNCPQDMAPSEQKRVVEHLISVLCQTNLALAELQKLVAVCLMTRKDFGWGNLKLEQHERSLQMLRKNNKHLVTIWRKHLASENQCASGQSAIRLAALATVFSQNLTTMQQTRQNIAKRVADEDEIQFRNAVSKIIDATNYQSIFQTPKDVYWFLKEQLLNCGCDVLTRQRPESVILDLNLLGEAGVRFSCDGWNLHIIAIRELYENHGECLPALEALDEWALLYKAGERSPEEYEQCMLANGPNSYWDP